MPTYNNQNYDLPDIDEWRKINPGGSRSAYNAWKRDYRDKMHAQIDAKRLADKEANKPTFDQKLKLRDQLFNESFKTQEQAKAQNIFDYTKNKDQKNYLLNLYKQEVENNKIRATKLDPLNPGETFLDPEQFAKYNEVTKKTLFENLNPSSAQQNSSSAEIFKNLSEEQKQKLLYKFQGTNKWGDDLTKDAPRATTEYKDGQRLWEYPGNKDPETGEVRNYMKITSPYGSEEEYQNRPAVVGQREDGSWIWDENPKVRSGGGFFQRGGLSDLGHAIAGDSPRRLPKITQPNQQDPTQLNMAKYLQRNNNFNAAEKQLTNIENTDQNKFTLSNLTNFFRNNITNTQNKKDSTAEDIIKRIMIEQNPEVATSFNVPPPLATINETPVFPAKDLWQGVKSFLTKKRSNLEDRYSVRREPNDWLSTSRRLNQLLSEDNK